MPVNTPAVISTDTAIATGSAVVTLVAIKVFQQLTGDNAFSENDKDRLQKLKSIREATLHAPLPPGWQLDEKNRPVHRFILGQDWSAAVRPACHYHYYCSLIVDYASTYLKHRAGRRMAGGYRGDIYEMFFGDLIYFALNELPTCGFDEASAKKLAQWILYLEKVQKSDVFGFGFLQRTKNTPDAMESIKEALTGCLRLAEQESLRQCAREKLDHCRQNIAMLLGSVARTLYYARKTSIHEEPLEFARFLSSEEKFLTVSARILYPAVKKTHTGLILSEVIALAGLRAFGLQEEKSEQIPRLKYFTQYGGIRNVEWDSMEADLPPWVTAQQRTRRLSEYQMLGESVIRVAQLKQLVEDAYDLAGKIGDLWAYGDAQGKLSLQAVFFLLENETKLLRDRYYAFHHYHNTQRHAWNLKYRINFSKGLNPNFNRIDEQKSLFASLYDAICQETVSMRKQMVHFPENYAEQINEQKKRFYHAIEFYFLQFRPKNLSEYAVFHTDERLSPKPGSVRDPFPSMISGEDNLPRTITLTWPLKVNRDRTRLPFLDWPGFGLPASRRWQAPHTWRLGENYLDWMYGYFIWRKKDYLTFQTLARRLQDQATDPDSIEEVSFCANALWDHIAILQKKIEDERPAWRFKWGIWPVRTKGWPFNRRADQFAKKLLLQLEETSRQINTAMVIGRNALYHRYVIGGSQNRSEKTVGMMQALNIRPEVRSGAPRAIKEKQQTCLPVKVLKGAQERNIPHPAQKQRRQNRL